MRDGRISVGELKVGDILWKRIHAGGGLFDGPIIRVIEILSGQIGAVVVGVVLEQRDGPWPVGSTFLGNLSELRKPPEGFEEKPNV